MTGFERKFLACVLALVMAVSGSLADVQYVFAEESEQGESISVNALDMDEILPDDSDSYTQKDESLPEGDVAAEGESFIDPNNPDIEWWYEELEDGTVSIRGWESVSSSEKVEYLEVPDMVDGFEVSRIEESAFGFEESLKSIKIPSTVKEIGERAFYNSSNLESVDLGGAVSIEMMSFDGCTNLEDITFPDSLEYVGDHYSTYGLMHSSVGIEDTKWYANQPDGVIYMGKVLYGYKGDMPENTSISVKEGTKVIAGNALKGYSNLVSVNIPKSVTKIQYSTFNSCVNLRKVEFGSESNLELLGDYCFSADSALEAIDIPQSVTAIGLRAFKHSSSLSSINFPSKLDSMGYECFMGTNWYTSQPYGAVYAGNVLCGYKEVSSRLENPDIDLDYDKDSRYNLNEITQDCLLVEVKDGTRGIADGVFWSGNGVLGINLPEGLVFIGKCAFYDGINSIIVPKSVQSIGDCAFGYGSPGSVWSGDNDRDSISTGFGFQTVRVSKIPDFAVCGVPGSEAEKYAKKCGFFFTDKRLPDCTVSGLVESYVYADGQITPWPTISLNYHGNTVDSSNYTIIRGNYNKIGTAYAIIQGRNDFAGTIVKTFELKGKVEPTGTRLLSSQVTSRTDKIPQGAAFTVTSSDASNPTASFDGVSDENAKAVTIPKTIIYNGVEYKVTTVSPTAFTKDTENAKFTVTDNRVESLTVEYKAPADTKKTKAKTSVPQYTTYKGIKFKVTSVAAKSFRNNKKVTRISIASSITKIGDSCFEGCTNLKTVTIGKGLQTIGKNAFKNCKKLTKITIKSAKLKTVGKNVLKGVNAKCKIKVPSKQLKKYQKLFKKKGQKSSVKVVK